MKRWPTLIPTVRPSAKSTRTLVILIFAQAFLRQHHGIKGLFHRCPAKVKRAFITDDIYLKQGQI